LLAEIVSGVGLGELVGELAVEESPVEGHPINNGIVVTAASSAPNGCICLFFVMVF
jgi:hypothetical protein